MSLVFNMVGGGSGGGLTDGSALLSVTVPADSTVTATKSGVTLMPSLWLAGADASTEIALFVFTPAQIDAINPWTITATDGTYTAAKPVLIATNTEYEAEIHYRLYIIKDGLFQNGYSFLYSLRSGHSPTITENYNDSGYLMVSMGSSYATGGVTEQIDITDYSILCAQAYKNNGNSYVGIWPGYNYGSQSAIESAAVAKTAVPTTSSSITVDISALNGEYYIGGCILADNNYQLFISDMWLE